MQVSEEVAEIVNTVISLAKNAGFEFVTPELMLFVICQNKVFARAFQNCGGRVKELDYHLREYLEEYCQAEELPGQDMAQGGDALGEAPELSQGMGNMLTYAWESALNSGREMVELPHIIHAMYALEESYAVYYMRVQGVEEPELFLVMIIAEEGIGAEKKGRRRNGAVHGVRNSSVRGRRSGASHGAGSGWLNGAGDRARQEAGNESDGWEKKKKGNVGGGDFEDDMGDDGVEEADMDEADMEEGAFWQQYAVCLNDALEGVNPLIGRTEELERTMQILCRKAKNNPLHLGEPGVGKTAVTYGLARLLNEGRVPAPLLGAKIFALDLGSLLAGTQYRGDFEKRFKRVMESISHEEKPIVYIDEIHNIVGAGAVGGGTFDISNMLKPYLASGSVRFIGASTYEEYKKHFEKSKSLVRRFQNIDIKEPDVSETVGIMEGLKPSYEEFHGVVYEEGVLEYAVEMSAKYVNERYLPDKAIDLMDEAGAYRRMHPLDQKIQSVDKTLIDEILSKTCNIPKQIVEKDETAALATLEERLLGWVFGQEEAVGQVVNAVKFARAGLLEEGKPLASLLFVGPTGVGKTEIARSLAKELGIKLIRFDMSEYEEKHAVAKLIGAPAGYVGYEEGGLLTEEIRKNPHAVLLLDEIEKAHPDIYNILLQVMDYATLTDNQGRKADFRNVIVIMTSNAGASRIGKHGIGFLGQDVRADVILEEVKKIFQPEFRNRLNRIVVFHGINERMAEQIVEKKLGELGKLLEKKGVKLTADGEAGKLIKKKGISAEFGAREIERVIQGEIKPLLVDEILFGELKNGGECVLTAEDGAFRIRFLPEAGNMMEESRSC